MNADAAQGACHSDNTDAEKAQLLQIVELEQSEGTNSLHTIDGRQIFEQQIANSRTSLEIGRLVNGIYLISFTQTTGERLTKRFVKQ